MNDCVDTSKIAIRKINKSLAKDMIVKNHYLHRLTICTIAYGVFYKTKDSNQFFDTDAEQLIGTVVYAVPTGRNIATSISKLLKQNEVIELSRLWIADGYGKNIESYAISRSITLLKDDLPNVKCILSYSDIEQSHCGIIYQSCNFLFLGLNTDLNLMPHYSISLIGPPYKWIHSRSVYDKWGTQNIDHLKKAINQTFYRKKDSGKFKYVLFIGTRQENRRYVKALKYPVQPYPKTCNCVIEIEKIPVDNSVL